MKSTHFDVTQSERQSGVLATDKLAQIRDSFEINGYAVVGGLISAETCELLLQSIIGDVAQVRTRDKLTRHERVTAVGHLQLGPRRCAPFVKSEIVANAVIENVVSELLGAGAWLGFYNGNVNCPDSGHQPLHYDRPFSWKSEAEAAAAGQSWPPPTTTVSCSIALSNITVASGATEIYPGTHHETAVTEWQVGEQPGKHPELIEQWGPPGAMIIPAGGVCFRDPRMWHRGVPNPSGIPRPMLALTYHSGLAKHQRGLLVPDMSEEDQQRCEADPTLRVLDSGEIGDGRLVFDESARAAFESVADQHGVVRNARFINPPFSVNHFVDAHLLGGARVVNGEQITPYPASDSK